MDWIIIIGLTAAVLTTSSFVPQVIKILRTKGTKDISFSMYIIIITGFFLWLTYGLLIKNPPIILANVISLSLALIVLIFKKKYG